MNKLYAMIVETIDTDTAELMSKNIMAVSHSIDKLKEHLAQVNHYLEDYGWRSVSDNKHSLYIAGCATCTIITIEEVTFIQ